MQKFSPLVRYRAVLGFFISGLVISGVTAFPLLWELRLLTWFIDSIGIPTSSGLSQWIHHVRDGLADMYGEYPWIAYGTDWLAFGHLAIAVFFVGAWLDPANSRTILLSGIVACVGVIPLAMICGPIRGIPLYWRLIDCSFGVIGILPLLYCLKLQPQLRPAVSIS